MSLMKTSFTRPKNPKWRLNINGKVHYHSLAIFLLIFLISPKGLDGQSATDALKNAVTLSQSGKFQKAEDIFNSLESETPEVQIHRAYNYSWWGKYEKANEIFKKIISENPKNVDAYIGIAYNNTWRGLYANAVQYYMKALELEPSNKSALYGLAHNYNGSLNADGLEYALDRISNHLPADAEYFFLKGRMHALKLQNIQAKKAYKAGLQIDSDFEPIKDQLRVFEAQPTKFFVSGWYGLSQSQNTINHSVRRIDLAYNHSEKLYLYGGYDNTLIMQNTFLRNLEGNAPYYFTGAKFGLTKKYFVRAEVGYRPFIEIPNQTLYTIENIFFLNPSILVSTFHLLDDRGNESLLGNGITTEVKWIREFRTSLSYFRTDNLNISGLGNQRILFVPKLSVKNVAADFGLYYDWNNDLSIDQNLYGFYALMSVPVINRLDLRLLFQSERGNPELASDLFSLGLTLKF